MALKARKRRGRVPDAASFASTDTSPPKNFYCEKFQIFTCHMARTEYDGLESSHGRFRSTI